MSLRGDDRWSIGASRPQGKSGRDARAPRKGWHVPEPAAKGVGAWKRHALRYGLRVVPPNRPRSEKRAAALRGPANRQSLRDEAALVSLGCRVSCASGWRSSFEPADFPAVGWWSNAAIPPEPRTNYPRHPLSLCKTAVRRHAACGGYCLQPQCAVARIATWCLPF
jgi:hypothetical protein